MAPRPRVSFNALNLFPVHAVAFLFIFGSIALFDLSFTS
jgi:hypothetical protein